MKDVLHKFMNILLPLISFILAVFILPPFLLFKLVYSLARTTIFIEDVAGKVVAITGASSGIGEVRTHTHSLRIRHVAYEYAKRGACLVLVARREDRLRIVGDKAKQLGSPDVLVVKADVSNIADCKNFVDQTILHFHKHVAGKVVVITGASSGLGENVAYEYAKRGACLVLVARREELLRKVADKAKQLGSPDVLVVKADVSSTADCKNFVDQTIQHFHKLDHLVNNAGVAPVCMFEDYKDVNDHKSAMDVNFWGAVYSTQFALPHLKQSKGKIIVISSVLGWSSWPRLSIYCATKAALISFFETLRTEVGSEIGITIVTPGMLESDLTNDEFLSKTKAKSVPLESVEDCAQAIVNGSRSGDRFLMEPAWLRPLFYWNIFCPELLEWSSRVVLITWPRESGKTKTS